ncbi:MAG: methyltransferase domain-containing protein [Candidatus Limnocylindrales bacterium]
MIARADRVIVDLGTGDGRAVVRRAAADPAALVIGIDAAASAMREASQRAARRGPSNALFLAAGVETLGETVLAGRADVATVTMPWGSLLRGVLGLDLAAMVGIASVVAPAGRVVVLASIAPLDGIAGIATLDATMERDIRRAWADIGIDLLSMRPASLDDVAASGSSWARRLRSGARDRAVWRLELGRRS